MCSNELGLCEATVGQWREVYPQVVEIVSMALIAAAVMGSGAVAVVLLLAWRRRMVRRREERELAPAVEQVRRVQRGRRRVYPVQCAGSDKTVWLRPERREEVSRRDP